MTTYLHLVFSDPPDEVSEDDYSSWYDAHVREILAVDGWIAATRFRVGAVADAGRAGDYRFLSLYELDVEPEVAIANLEAAGMGSSESYVDLKTDAAVDDPLPLPDWFAGIRFVSWNATSTGDRITATA